MKIQNLALIALLSVSAGCGSRVSQNEKGAAAGQQDSRTSMPPSGHPQAKTIIQHNRSEIIGEIVDIKEQTDSSFTVVVRVLEITEDASYPSVAVKNNVYEVYPGFVLDERKKIADTQRNRSLLSLKHRKTGDTIKGVIFLGGDNKWIIKDLSE